MTIKNKTLIKKLLSEALKYRVKLNEHPERKFKKLSLLLEKKIKVGDNLTKKLNSINSNLSANILNFLNSDNIKDNANVDYVDYDSKDEKLLTVGYIDNRGNNKENKLKINKLLKYLGSNIDNIKDYEVEELINHLKKGDLEDFKIFSGEDLLKIYHCNNYDEGETMGSCMRYEYAQEYLQIYTDNPNQVRVLALLNPENGKVRGRALLWVLDDGSILMDRVYVTNSQYKVNFNTYAEEKGLTTTPKSNVTLENGGDYDEYPYMDSLMFYTPSTGVLSPNEGEITLQDTHGGHSGSGNWSEVHGENIPEDESCYVDHIDDWVYCNEIEKSYDTTEYLYVDSDDVVRLSNGEYKYSYAKEEDTVRTFNDEIILADEAGYIDKGDYEGEYALYDDLSETFEDNMVLSHLTIELTNGEWEGMEVLEEDAFMVMEDNEEHNVVEGDIITKYDAKRLDKLGVKVKKYE